MKKLALTTLLLLSLGFGAMAQEGGLFGMGPTKAEETGLMNRDVFPNLPGHGETTDQPAPLGTGTMLMLGLGAAYLVSKKHREE